MRRIVWTMVGTLAGIAVIGLIVIYSGAYNVAATQSHTALTSWVLNTLQRRSVAMRADEADAPPELDAAALQHAFSDYRTMCAVCHGAPGVERGEFGQGITPRPPRLERAATRWSEREIRWILEHGIKLAGMPAFGATHSDKELWALTAVVKRLPELSAEEYRRLSAAEAEGPEGRTAAGEHAHED